MCLQAGQGVVMSRDDLEFDIAAKTVLTCTPVSVCRILGCSRQLLRQLWGWRGAAD